MLHIQFAPIVSGHGSSPEPAEYEAGLDNEIAVLHNICGWMVESGRCRFIFHHEDLHLPVEHAIEWVIFFEELPHLLAWLDEVKSCQQQGAPLQLRTTSSKEFVLHFHEQGVDWVTRLIWNPIALLAISEFAGERRVSVLDLETLEHCLTDSLRNFVAAAMQSHQDHLTHPVFASWWQHPSIRRRLWT